VCVCVRKTVIGKMREKLKNSPHFEFRTV